MVCAVDWEAVPDRLERPTRDHALDFARRMFVRGERVDMGELAAALGVGRTTLYRWVGDRERLIGDVLATLSRRTFDLVAEQAEGDGLERGLDAIRRFMEVTSAFPPLRRFAESEPGPALRVLMAEHGAVTQEVRRGFGRALEEIGGRPVDDEVLDVLVQLATAMEWAPIVAGEEPAIDRAVRLMHTVLETNGGARPRGRRRAPAG